MTREYRVAVTGGRDFSDADHVAQALDPIMLLCRTRGYQMILINGLARGADSLCRSWAITNYVKTWDFPADWDKHGKAAGHIRNAQMLDEGKPHICIAFPGGKGTANMVKQAQSRLVLVVASNRIGDHFP